ncbi:SpoVT-AbrB domain-containing protein [Candidatus Electrothrix aarhusensis]
MTVATLTTKGQVTIPKKIREVLRLHAGDKIEIIVTEKREAVIRPISKKVDDVFCRLHQPGRKAVSVDEMNKTVTRKLKEKFT